MQTISKKKQQIINKLLQYFLLFKYYKLVRLFYSLIARKNKLNEAHIYIYIFFF